MGVRGPGCQLGSSLA